MDTILRLIAICFVVGLVIAVAGVDPLDLWRDLGGTIADVWHLFWDTAHWAVKYIVLGAVIVIPIWLVVTLIQRASTPRSS